VSSGSFCSVVVVVVDVVVFGVGTSVVEEVFDVGTSVAGFESFLCFSFS